MTQAHLETLNPDQRAAVEHGLEAGSGSAAPAGPLLVIAGAGSGKTATLAHRVGHLILNGADPRRLLLLTFSRRAAAEMGRRVERILRQTLGEAAASAATVAWAGTFHAVGARILRDYARELGLDPAFTIHDRDDSADLMNLVRHDLGLSAKASRFPTKQTCVTIYSRVVNAEAELGPTLRAHYPWCVEWEDDLKRLFGLYVETKQKHNVLDYDDLLLYWAGLLGDPTLAADLGGRFDHVLVDEYQDTNRLQGAILAGLKPDGRGVTVVGDDAQSIYSFRAATVRNILDFPGQFEPPARVVTLARNYRSTRPILAASNAVIGLASERFANELWSDRSGGGRPELVTVRDEADQARFVAERVLEAREAGTVLKDQAVLFRTSHHSGPLEIELARRNIPFVKFGGLKFLDAAHVKDLLALLRFAENPRDRVAGFRVIQILPGIGPAHAGRALDRVAEAEDPAEALEIFEPPARAAEDWRDLAALYRRLVAREADWPAELDLIRRWYRPHLERRHDDTAPRSADLDQLERIAAGFPTRERFMTELTLDPPAAASDESGPPLKDEDYLILSTIHSAKGQEWAQVFVLNAVDGCLPSDLATGSSEEIEEERRLLYVAMTRAKDRLALITPQRFYTHGQPSGGDRHVTAARTRFIPGAILPHFELVAWPAPESLSVRGTRPELSVRLDMAARMRGMWR